ncbi:MAG: hypothetical protein IFK94_00365 [Acidobacteria bacterium]|uniref:Uncharacterized protein n=1 Tax=Candidatus Polarisedimenticola svalbardensis TaxID=2886004 RepID=A0A8J7CDC8_9BACT|nr:hypothetical protein [Candidatus Polarisedimenticola svalbardensis]
MRRTFALLAVVLCCLIPMEAADNRPGDPVWYADLDKETLAALNPGESTDILTAILETGVPYRFDHRLFTVYTDRRWYASSPSGQAGAPLMILRRWPGDTVLAFYELAGEDCSSSALAAPVSGGSFKPARPGAEGRPVCVWDGSIAGESGDYPARWVERRVPERPYRLGALLLPGNAGLGREAVPGLMMELQAVLGRTMLNVEAWPLEQRSMAAGAVPPDLGMPPGDRSEAEDPWQTALARGFSLGLPPGLRAMRTDSGPGATLAVPGGLLWIRGRFTDRDGDLVVVGDWERAGYVAGVNGADPEWPRSTRLPAGVRAGERLAIQDFDVVRDRTGATAATAARWRENGFEGEWLVFRLAFPGTSLEIGFPMLEGRQSEALFWLPTTIRTAGRPPAPPPLDPAERFGITFERLTGSQRKETPWMEGYLSVPGLRIEIPVGWYPVNALRTRDGFPVRMFDKEGELCGILERVNEAWFTAFDPADGGWEPIPRPGRFRALEAWRNRRGARLFRSKTGGGFRLVPQAAGSGEGWERMLGTVQMIRPGR